MSTTMLFRASYLTRMDQFFDVLAIFNQLGITSQSVGCHRLLLHRVRLFFLFLFLFPDRPLDSAKI